MELTISILIFVLAYALIVTERVHRTVVALAAAGAMLVFRVLDQQEAFHSKEFGIDYNVIFLLIGMMIIVNVLKNTGVFEFVAIWSAKRAKGDPLKIMLVFCLITAVSSAFLDNVTTILLMAPVAIYIAQRLKLDPVPFLITQALASNIGGTATLVGDPPNIMIASRTGLSFMDFLSNLAPVIVIILAGWLLIVAVFFRNWFHVPEELKAEILGLNEQKALHDPKLLGKSGAVLGLTIIGFFFHGALGYEPATVALVGAGLLLVLNRTDPHDILTAIEWNTIFFFIGLFVIVGGVAKAGAITVLADKTLDLVGDNFFFASMLVLWASVIFSAFMDNVPYVAVMNPLIADLARSLLPGQNGADVLQNPQVLPIWWALALGAGLGGNATLIGATANVIVAGASERSGFPITFGRFLKYGVPVTLFSLLVATAYMIGRYYVLPSIIG